VDVDVDETRSDDLASEIDDFDVAAYLDVLRNFSDQPVPQEDVAHAIQSLARVDGPPASE
jgi:hypothetical protein